MIFDYHGNILRTMALYSLSGWALLLPRPGQCQKSITVKWESIQRLLDSPDDSLTVINFWATWCKPCVKELPHFEKLRKEWKDKPLRFRYISLDFKDEKTKRLDPFTSKNLKGAHVWLLDETDYNAWIDRVDPHWEGGIPATLFINNSKKIRKFVATELSGDNLRRIIQSCLHP